MFCLLLKVKEVLPEFHFTILLDYHCRMLSQVFLIHTNIIQDWWQIKHKVNYLVQYYVNGEETALFYQGHTVS